MNTQKLGISVGNYFQQPPEEMVRVIKDIGFHAVSPIWDRDGIWKETIHNARKNGLIVQSLHAPYKKSMHMWNQNSDLAAAALAEFSESMRECAALSVPILVVHGWGGLDFASGHISIGLRNFSILAEQAAKLDIQIAFENLEGEPFLYALMDHFQDAAHIGFCWDSGHEHCYNHDRNLLADFGSRLLVTHLNDNPGIQDPNGMISPKDDLHYLPLDGTVNWEEKTLQLQKARKQDILNFEVKQFSKVYQPQNKTYACWTFPEFLTEAYQRAKIIANMYMQRRDILCAADQYS